MKPAAPLTIVYETVDTLKPYVNNAKRHSDEQVKALAESIKEFGFTSPVLIDEDNGIVAGHGRVQAAKALGMELVPCVRLTGLTDVQRKAYILADNRLAEIGGGWDTDLLRNELRAIESEMPDLAQAAGWSDNELLALLRDNSAPDIQIENTVHKETYLEDLMERRKEVMIRQIMLIYAAEEYGKVIEALADYADKHGLANNTEVITHLLEQNGYAVSQRQV